MRTAKIKRETSETKIDLRLNIDGNSKTMIESGIGFFDHMLQILSFHAKMGLEIQCQGDTYVDDHHSVEDIGLALGAAFRKALGDRVGIRRYSNVFIPMDEALAQVSLDISSRPCLVYKVETDRERIGGMDTQTIKEFFKSFVNESKVTLHINLVYGENDHHKIEAVFKAFARALKEASRIESDIVNSSKGVL